MANKSSQVLSLRALLPSSTPFLCFSRCSNLVIQKQPPSKSSSSDTLSLHPPSLAVVTESVLSVFGWAHRKKMCNSSTSSFIFPPGQRLGRTLMLPNKTAWMYVHAAELWCSFESLSSVIFIMIRVKTGKTPLLQLLQLCFFFQCHFSVSDSGERWLVVESSNTNACMPTQSISTWERDSTSNLE